MEQYAATIGFFDGVHRGHQCLIQQVKALANEKCVGSMIVTFDCHPRQVLCDDYQPKLLSLLDDKLSLLKDTGVDRVEVIPFDLNLSRLSALEFMCEILQKRLKVRYLLMGYDHRFGHGGGTFDQYVEWGRLLGMDVVLAEELKGEKVSSSLIRRLVSEGNLEVANSLLGHTYIIEGNVMGGQQVGRTIGFPTANVKADAAKLLPAVGVYVIEAELADGRFVDGMLCIGRRPTVLNDGEVTVEAHLFDFEGDLYNTLLRLRVLARLRDEKRFASLEELRQQLQKDELMARNYLRNCQ